MGDMTTAASPQYKSLVEVENKYKKCRETAHRCTVKALRAGSDPRANHLTITGLTEHAISTFKQNWNQSARMVDWDWEELTAKTRRKKPSFWEMAIWHKQTLCGMVLGYPSRRRSRLYVEGIEGNPESNPLKSAIIPIALLCSERYAESIGCSEVWLVSPAPALVDLYARAGYNLRLPSNFLARVFRKTTFAVKKVGVPK